MTNLRRLNHPGLAMMLMSGPAIAAQAARGPEPSELLVFDESPDTSMVAVADTLLDRRMFVGPPPKIVSRLLESADREAERLAELARYPTMTLTAPMNCRFPIQPRVSPNKGRRAQRQRGRR
jgi:hypothetical protein